MQAIRNILRKYWIFILTMTSISAIVGTGLGVFGGLAHSENAWLAGGVLGLVSGIVVGVCYSLAIGRFNQKRRVWWGVLIYGTLIGAMAGLVSSASVHLPIYLQSLGHDFARLVLYIGILCGPAAGAILGLISSLIVFKCYNNSSVSSIQNQKTEAIS